MRISKLELSQIRSYTSQIIEFDKGMTLLSGDIGSGKSTILQAIEFAFFGLLRGAGSTLLRHGEKKGFVILTFHLGEKSYSIKRGLNRTKTSVIQTTGYLDINGIREELTATELTTRIVDILGYPEHFKQKDVNLLYRYTVYTSQERMKEILLESPENRLQTLRAIFGIDKYKTIVENATVVQREMRTKQRVGTEQIRVLPQIRSQFSAEKEKQTESQERLALSESEFAKVSKQKQEIELHIAKLRDELEEKRLFNEKQTLLESQKKSYEDQEKQIREKLYKLTSDLDELMVKKREFPESIDTHLDKITVKLKQTKESYDAQYTIMLKRKQELTFAKERLPKITAELHELEKTYASLQQIDLTSFEKVLLTKPSVEQSLTELSARLLAFEKKHSTISSRISHAKDSMQKLCEDTCPLCLQEINGVEKQEAFAKQIDADTAALTTIEQKQQELTLEKKQLEQKLKAISDAEKEQAVLQEKKSSLAEILKKLDSVKEEREKLSQQLSQDVVDITPQKTQLEAVQQEYDVTLRQKQELTRLVDRISFLEQEKKSSLDVLSQIHSKITSIQIQPKIDIKPLQEKLTIVEKEAQDIQTTFLTLSNTIASTKQAISSATTLLNTLHSRIQELEETQKEITKFSSLEDWIKRKFIPLMLKLEQTLLSRAYVECNAAFAQWFAVLAEDELIQARLDETFTPIIMQNGYETEFSQLSGGEKTSIALAYRLALNKVVNDIVKDIRTKDLLILDEPTDGFSTEQLDRVRDVFAQLTASQTIIVSHEPKVETFVQHIVRVSKSEHESSVK